MKKFRFIYPILILFFSNHVDAQSAQNILLNSLTKYFDKNSRYFSSDTILYQNESKTLIKNIPGKIGKINLIDFKEKPKSYFEIPKFILCIKKVQSKNKIEITLSEKLLEFNVMKNEWIISYNSHYIFFYRKKGAYFVFQKYEQRSL